MISLFECFRVLCLCCKLWVELHEIHRVALSNHKRNETSVVYLPVRFFSLVAIMKHVLGCCYHFNGFISAIFFGVLYACTILFFAFSSHFNAMPHCHSDACCFLFNNLFTEQFEQAQMVLKMRLSDQKKKTFDRID